jgi:hypothetical protein
VGLDVGLISLEHPQPLSAGESTIAGYRIEGVGVPNVTV